MGSVDKTTIEQDLFKEFSINESIPLAEKVRLIFNKKKYFWLRLCDSKYNALFNVHEDI